MRVFKIEYKKYNLDSNNKELNVVAGSIAVALAKAEKIVKKNYASRVVSMKEILNDVEVA